MATTPLPASVPSPAEANPPAAVKPAEVSVAPAAPPEKAPAPFQPSPVVAAPPDPGPRPGFKLTASLSAGLGVLNRPTYYSAASNTITDRETAPEFGFDLEARWRFGALSLAGGATRTSNTTLIPVRLGLVWDY